ncbi:hypothetical protein OY671_012396, partial [Metschnikowia pulcherrima]
SARHHQRQAGPPGPARAALRRWRGRRPRAADRHRGGHRRAVRRTSAPARRHGRGRRGRLLRPGRRLAVGRATAAADRGASAPQPGPGCAVRDPHGGRAGCCHRRRGRALRQRAQAADPAGRGRCRAGAAVRHPPGRRHRSGLPAAGAHDQP